MDDVVWKGIFNHEGIRRRMRFRHYVDTDGVKICFHFEMTIKDVNKRRRRKRRCYSKQDKKEKEQRVIAIDPGRSNLIMGYDKMRNKYYRLTRKYYYRATGIKAKNRRCERRNLELRDVYEKMTTTPTRSIVDEDWKKYQKIVTENYNRLWSVNTREEIKKDNFETFRLKQKCMDRFFNRFEVKGEKKPIVAYGGATFNPTGKGEMTVPVKYVYKKCSEKYRTKLVNEYYTTAMHYECRQTTTGVKLGLETKTRRGLRWCPTCRKLVSRDKNACLNIGYVYTYEKERKERPKYLTITYKREEERCKRLLRCNRSQKE